MTGSLHKKNKKWYAVINVYNERGERKQKWISTGKEKKSDATKILNKLLVDMDNGNYIDPVKTLFSDFMLDWLDNVIKRHIEQTTWEGYTTNIKTHIVPYFKAKRIKLNDLKPIHLQKYFEEKFKENLSSCYLKKHRANIKKALDYAVSMGFIAVNPVNQVKLPKNKKIDINYYSTEMLENLLEVTQDTLIESPVYLTVHYGFRRGEVLGLRWRDIDFSEEVLNVCNTRTRVSREIEKKPKSESSIRKLPLIPRVKEYLLKLKEQQAIDKQEFGNEYIENDYVCKYADGTPVNVNTLNHVFKRILENNKMNHIRFHDLRHSTASFLLKNGVSLKEIQVWLGHSDISITANTYTHVDAEMKKHTANRINEIFKAS